jgi:hypothetical protein
MTTNSYICESFDKQRLMRKPVFKPLFLRIQLAEFLARLNSLNESYLSGNRTDYSAQMNDLIENVRQFANTFAHHSAHRMFQQYSAVGSQRNAEDLFALSPQLEQYILDLFDSITSNQRTRRKSKRAISIGIVFVLLIVGAFAFRPLRETYDNEKQLYTVASNEEVFKQQIITDILSLKTALEKYHASNKGYPKSSGGFDAINAAFGESKEDWIPGLAPKYIKTLPRDPRHSKSPREQYMYKSDGHDYKLIAHNPLGMDEAAKAHPELVDPARPSWAVGVWSEGAVNW